MDKLRRGYLASPYGFAESTRDFLSAIKAVLVKENIEPIDPWELTSLSEVAEAESIDDATERLEALKSLNWRIGERNHQAIDSSDWLLASLDGPDVDSGTASEIGYAFARGKKIIGYRGDFRQSGDNEATVVNLQIQYWIEASGGTIVRSISELGEVLRALVTEGERASITSGQ